jgi:predicted DNA-binding protein
MPRIERKTAAATYTLRLKPEQMQKLKARAEKVGVPVPEQIRRGIDLWLKQQEAGR